MNNNVKNRFCLCGDPVAHSLSPKLFAAAYQRDDFCYELIPASTPQEAICLFLEGGFGAMNVTAPLKSSILPLTHGQTPECKTIGACNLILKQKNKLIAHNTDYLGVANALYEASIPIKNVVCLLLGAGGAAKAAAYTLLKGGATLLWTNRTPAHIPHLFMEKTIVPIPLSEAIHILPATDIIINTLPQPVPDTEGFTFHSHQIVFDASYYIRHFEKQANQAGAKYIGGERWLLHQAIPSFEVMTGMLPDIRAMELLL